MGTLAVVELPLRTGLPKDKVVNTFAIAENAVARAHGDTESAAIVTAISRLYNASITSMGGALGQFMSPAISRTALACAVKLYSITDHLDGSPHGSPYYLGSFTMPTALSSTPMPEEVALCVTLEAQGRGSQFVEVPDGTDPDAKPDRPRQRYTGRVYIGPFADGQVVADGAGMARPVSTLTTGLRDGVKRMIDEVAAVGSDARSVGVWSRQNRAIRGVEFVRTDDAWDTQRRRGASPSVTSRLAVSDAVPEIELAS